MDSKTRFTKVVWVISTLLLVVLSAWLWMASDSGSPRKMGATPPSTASSEPAAPASRITTSGHVGKTDAIRFRPLEVARKTPTHEWTAGDGSDLKVIEAISHNYDETIKMVEENDRIKRRQLVYRNDTAAAVIQRARLTGEPIRHLTLPALDGQELDFEIDHADLSPSGQSGSFTGKLAGKPQSMVTLAFKFGREAFTVISPEDDFHLQADPREPGEIIVKSIDPDVYAAGQCGVVENPSPQGH